MMGTMGLGLDPFFFGDPGAGGYFTLPSPSDSTSGGGILGSLVNFGLNTLGGYLQGQLPAEQIPSIYPGVGYPNIPPAPVIRPRVSTSRRGYMGPQGLTYRVNVGRGRRMNACNPRALRRAIRRVKHFEKFAKQSVRIGQRVKLKKGRGRKICR